MFADIFWDPAPYIIIIPKLNLPITWYGFLFALGFYIGYHIFLYLFASHIISSTDFNEREVNFKKMNKEGMGKFYCRTIKECDLLSSRIEEGALVGIGKSFWMRMVMAVSKKQLGESLFLKVKKRLYLEEKFPKIFIPLKERAIIVSDQFLLYLVLATIIGARLGHLIFYENFLFYLQNPWLIFKVWEGGLASHGGIFALLISIYLFYRKIRGLYPQISLFTLSDFVAIPTMLVGVFIRIGNFMNQEIVGKATNLPWGITFLHPMDHAVAVARHPSQLYEAITYLLIFFFLVFYWYKKNGTMNAGRITAIAIFLAFFFRFLIEFTKYEQSVNMMPIGGLLMGHYLSIPMMLFGMGLFYFRSTSYRSSH